MDILMDITGFNYFNDFLNSAVFIMIEVKLVALQQERKRKRMGLQLINIVNCRYC